MPLPQSEETNALLLPLHTESSETEADSHAHPSLETTSLLSLRPALDTKKKIVAESLKLLPVISSLLFIVVNFAPTFISCSLTWETECLKLSFYRSSQKLKWAFVIGNLTSTGFSIATIELLYSSMKKRYLVPEYIRNIIYLKINYMIGVLSAISCLLHIVLQLRLVTDLPKIDENLFLQIQLMMIVTYNAINLCFLHKLTKRKNFTDLLVECVLYRLKRRIFAFSSAIAAICVACGFLLFVVERNPYSEKLRLIHTIMTMAAVLANQAYCATYYVDLSLIDRDYQSKFDEECYFQKRVRNGKNLDSVYNF